MKELSAAGLADLAGVTEPEVEQLVELGILVPRDGAGPFGETDVQKVRLATACERAGLPMEGIASAIRSGRLSFAFLEAAPYRRWAVRSARTYRQVSQETGMPLELLGDALESMGFAPMAPDEPMREDELEVVPFVQLGHTTGVLDQLWATRAGRAHAEGLRLIATAWVDVYHARFEEPSARAARSPPTRLRRTMRSSRFPSSLVMSRTRTRSATLPPFDDPMSPGVSVRMPPSLRPAISDRQGQRCQSRH
jgi:hypothetical protein